MYSREKISKDLILKNIFIFYFNLIDHNLPVLVCRTLQNIKSQQTVVVLILALWLCKGQGVILISLE